MGMLQAAFERSPHAHANIKSVETPKAEALEGVVAVLTGAQLREEPADRDSISRLEEAGADRVIVAVPREAGVDPLSAIDELAEKVISR